MREAAVAGEARRMKEASLVRRRSGLICDKILRRHQDRLAIVYVRHPRFSRLSATRIDPAAIRARRSGRAIRPGAGTDRRHRRRSRALRGQRRGPGRSVPEGEGEATPEIVAPAAVGPSPAPDLLSKVGDGRIANFGCPHCGGYEVGRWGRANGRPRYRCKECRKTFGPLMGTPLVRLHYKDRWINQAHALEQAAKLLEFLPKSSGNM